jgi:hypothetical protein
MQAQGILNLYEIGRRGKPVATIQPGDLADPYGKKPWDRVVSFFSTVAEIARESRELERQMLGKYYYVAS